MTDWKKRWWKNATFIPYQSKWLTREVIAEFTNTIAKSEVGHNGEIRLVIERAMPLNLVKKHNSRTRAEMLFSLYRVWNTIERSGVLIYLNLAEHRLEIVADCGITAKVSADIWQELAAETTTGLQAGKYQASLTTLLTRIAQLLRKHYEQSEDPNGNELPNQVIVL